MINLNIIIDGTDRYEHHENFLMLKDKVLEINNGFFCNLKFMSHTQGTDFSYDLDQYAREISKHGDGGNGGGPNGGGGGNAFDQIMQGGQPP